MQHLVVDGAGEAAEKDVGEYDDGGEDDGEGKDAFGRPAEHVEEAVEDMQRLDEAGHGVHGDAGAEDGHHGEGAGIERAGLLVEPHAQELGHAAGLGAVVEGHHEDADEDHRGDGADAVEVGGLETIFRAGCAHADNFLRAEVG